MHTQTQHAHSLSIFPYSPSLLFQSTSILIYSVHNPDIQIKNSPIVSRLNLLKNSKESKGMFTFTLVPILSSRLVIPPNHRECSPISTRHYQLSLILQGNVMELSNHTCSHSLLTISKSSILSRVHNPIAVYKKIKKCIKINYSHHTITSSHNRSLSLLTNTDMYNSFSLQPRLSKSRTVPLASSSLPV